MNRLRFPPRRAPIYQDIPAQKWVDWRWQLSHRLNNPADFEKIFTLMESERFALDTEGLFRLEITPYFASLIDPQDPQDPVRKQVIPTSGEIIPFNGMMGDSLAEDLHSPVPGLVHRYPDRVLMLVTTQCASYCRYCTPARIVGDPALTFSRDEHEAQIDYIRRTPQVRDVLLSGGDPITLPQKVLEDLLVKLRSIPHVEIIRIGSRIPVFMPQRITTDLSEMLQRYHPLWLNTHVNHPNEITAELADACDKLSRAGIPIGNQTVLLAGINDCIHIQRKLVHDLAIIRVRPYYLYQCDLVEGAGHFRTPVAKGVEIIEGLRGHTSGFSIPQYVVDGPGGAGKVPMGPNYLTSMSDHKIVLRNYQGMITTYEEPVEYTTHNALTCKFCQNKRPESGQSGISGLLDGDEMLIRPEGFEELHKRGGARHRLRNQDDKWKPIGIVSGKSTGIE